MNEGSFSSARNDFDSALDIDDDSAEAWARKGQSYIREDDDNPENLKEAVVNSRKSIEKDPNLWVPHYVLGQVYNKTKDYDGAIDSLRRLPDLIRRII